MTGLLRDETFWIFSQHYFDPDFSHHLVKHDSVDNYLRIDKIVYRRKSVMPEQMKATSPSISTQQSEEETGTSVSSGFHEETISTNELFSKISESSYLEELKAKYAQLKAKEFNVQDKKAKADETSGRQDSGSESLGFRFDQVRNIFFCG